MDEPLKSFRPGDTTYRAVSGRLHDYRTSPPVVLRFAFRRPAERMKFTDHEMPSGLIRNGNTVTAVLNGTAICTAEITYRDKGPISMLDPSGSKWPSESGSYSYCCLVPWGAARKRDGC